MIVNVPDLNVNVNVPDLNAYVIVNVPDLNLIVNVPDRFHLIKANVTVGSNYLVIQLDFCTIYKCI